MSKKNVYTWWEDKCIIMLIIFSMLAVIDIEIAGFPLYVFLLFLVAAGWMVLRLRFHTENESLLPIRNLTDMTAVIAIGFEVFSVICKLFQNPDKGAIDFSINAEIIAFALLYILLSSEIQFKLFYMDLILYGGLFASTVFMLPFFTGEWPDFLTGLLFRDTGAASSFFLLISMLGVYMYCVCKERMRSWFYLLVTFIAFFALMLNHNIVSFWFMIIYFIAMPIVLRPTAFLVKKDMQMFFMFGFMLSNMSLLTGYTQIISKELSYSLEHSVYLDLLLAVCGVFFFHYWERIPEGIDLERLVMRKMRRGFKFLLKIMIIFFMGIVIGGDKWKGLEGGMPGAAFCGFAIPLADSVRQSQSAFYACFYDIGIGGGFFIIVFLILLISRMHRNFSFDKPLTGNLILVSSFFMIQLFFWKPAVNTLAVYFILFLTAAFNKEKRRKVTSVKIRKEQLGRQDISSGAIYRNMDKGAWL